MDVYQYFGGDISLTTAGDLTTVDGIIKSQQRILRRLLTNPGSYIFHVGYGGGLPKYVGLPFSFALQQQINGVVLTQMQLESSVAQNPIPQVSITAITQGIFVSINYTDAASNTPQVLSFSVTK